MYYLLGIISVLITVLAQIFVTTRYNKYKTVKNKKGLSGFEVAKIILEKNNLGNIYVVETKGILSDHYDPKAKVVRLSTEVFNGESISALAIAAHECGHAIQDKNNNKFMKFRSFLVPLVNFSSKLGYIVILLGLILGMLQLFYFGIILMVVILLFQLVTLPVEFGASKDALEYLEKYEIVTSDEKDEVQEVLTSAALTYVASIATTLLEIVRLMLLADRD